jgi:hypothetical protein
MIICIFCFACWILMNSEIELKKNIDNLWKQNFISFISVWLINAIKLLSDSRPLWLVRFSFSEFQVDFRNDRRITVGFKLGWSLRYRDHYRFLLEPFQTVDYPNTVQLWGHHPQFRSDQNRNVENREKTDSPAFEMKNKWSLWIMIGYYHSRAKKEKYHANK